ncbi:MAG: deoxyhypusine synthase [Desulfurococcales archaeon]|nr:deoxyhypusine synthase [Desulfurococcales archaeon]
MSFDFEPVRDVRVSKNMRIVDLIKLYGEIHGFTAASLHRAANILVEGIKNSDTKFLAFTGNLISTGIRGVIAQLIDGGYFNVIITTCGALDHDIARSLGGTYLKGVFEADDIKLKEHGYHRLGNIFIPIEHYGKIIEDFTKSLVNELVRAKKKWSISEVCQEVGRRLAGDENSVLGAAYRSGAKVFVPGIVDGAFGTNLYVYSQFTGFELDILSDMKKLADIVFTSKISTALILGGGISKHHTIWWNQFKGGLDYAVYVTTAIEWDGSLSGAKTREAISWGKVKSTAKHATVYGDVTVILPILTTYIINALEDTLD